MVFKCFLNLFNTYKALENIFINKPYYFIIYITIILIIIFILVYSLNIKILIINNYSLLYIYKILYIKKIYILYII